MDGSSGTAAAKRRFAFLFGRRRGFGERAPRTLMEAELTAAMAAGLCPVCTATARDTDHMMRFFALEGHGEPEVLARFRRAPFCTTHARYAQSRNDMFTPLGATQAFLIHRGRDGDVPLPAPPRRFGAGDDPACPACLSLRQTTDRALFFLAKLLRTEQLLPAAPRLICQTHLPRLWPLVLAEQMLWLLSGAAERLTFLEKESEGDAWQSVLRLTVGEKPPIAAWPAPGEVPARNAGNPACDLMGDVAEQADCPVCREMGRVLTHWAGWLAKAAEEKDKDLSDLLPTCRDHVWALAERAPPPLARASLAHIRDLHLERLTLALAKLPKSGERFGGRWPLKRSRASLRGWLMRPLRCRFCERLEVAETETLALLGGLLRLGHNREVFARGFGLCLRHTARFAKLCAGASVRDFVREVEAAKFALLGWELDAWYRKTAWQWRPDSRGTEMAAPWTALLRFSGGTALLLP